MQISNRTPRFAIAAVAILTFRVESVPTGAAEIAPLVYDLEWNGSTTSFVDECQLNGSCSQYPINGTIGVILGTERPHLSNIDSIVVTPIAFPLTTISEYVWQRLNWTLGEYLTDPQQSDLSMRFYPNPVLDTGQLPYELFVDLTEGRTMLTLTGGGDGPATLPNDVDSVEFLVSGRLVPEPSAALLAAVALAMGLSSRRRR